MKKNELLSQFYSLLGNTPGTQNKENNNNNTALTYEDETLA